MLSETHRRPTCLIGEPSETYRRPTFLIGHLDMPIGHRHAPSDTRMPNWWPACPIGNQHACGYPSEFKHIYFNFRILNSFFFLYCNNVRTLKRHGWSLMGLGLCMPVSDVSPIKHVCRSLIKHVGLQPRMSTFDGSLMGLR